MIVLWKDNNESDWFGTTTILILLVLLAIMMNVDAYVDADYFLIKPIRPILSFCCYGVLLLVAIVLKFF